MRFLPTKLHGAIDYVWGIVLLGAPFVLGFASDRPAHMVALAFGFGAIAYSLLTDYELGLLRIIPMPAHLVLDALAGIVLALLPFVLAIGPTPSRLFIALGLLAVVASLVTRTRPGTAGSLR